MSSFRSKLLVTGPASAVLLVFVLYWAYAHSTGITGQTLKSSPTAGCGAKVTGGGSCHGTTATSSIIVRITGPRVLAVGKAGAYTFSDSGSTGSGGGFDIAAGNGSLSSSSLNAQLLNGELTHKSAITLPYTIGFSLTSSVAGPDTLFANGKGSLFTAWNWAPNLIIRVGPPPAPVPDSPLAKSVGVSLTPRLVWSGIAGPRWTVEAATESTFAAPVLHQVVVGETTYTVKAGVLLNDTVYYWHVSATDTGGTSPYSLPRSFRTVVAPPPAPLLASPANNATGVPPNAVLRWRKSSGAASYRIQMSTDSTFTAMTRDSSGITDTSFAAGVLPNGAIFYWRVNGKNAGGTGAWSAVSNFVVSLTDVTQAAAGAPSSYQLDQNYPNPFNPTTKITFSLPATSEVRLAVYDLQGREIAVLAQGALAAGVYTTTFDAGASRVASGVYFYRLTATTTGASGTSGNAARSYIETRKLLVVK